MGGFAKTAFVLITGWFQSVASLIWNGFTNPQKNGIFAWIGDHWIAIAICLCLIGAGADLIVYLFRWRPLTVWKSFFARRKRKRELETDYPDDPDDETAAYDADGEAYADNREDGGSYQPMFASNRNDAGSAAMDRYPEENETVPTEYDKPEPAISAGPPVFEPAGGDFIRVNHTDEEMAYTDEAYGDGRAENPTRTRRRRVRLTSLLGDPDEEMIRFEPPQPVIDRNEAYHKPVYPRNWTENGDSSQ